MVASPQPRRSVPLEEALAVAIRLQQGGQLDDAEALFRRLIAAAPDHPDVLHFAGVLAYQRGRSDEAERLIRTSIDLKPDQPGWYSNLGIVLKARGDLDGAVEAYQHAIRLDPDHADAHSNLGVLLRAQGRLEEAEGAYRTAIRLAPEQPAAYHNLGVLLAGASRAEEAVLCYCKALTLNPQQPGTRTLLARAYYITGQREKAVELFEQWLREEPRDPVAEHMLAACSGKNVPARASDAYVERTFDDFAAIFDSKLAQLGYRAPQLVAAALADSGIEPRESLVVLDAGCGTGLCGPLMAPYAARLIGVDLSAGMLAQARERGVYDELIKDELTAHLEARRGAYDVIVSADTLVYFGALDLVIGAAARALRPGGVLVFTLEEADRAEAANGYGIKPHGRYTHRDDYVAAVLRDAGLQPRIERAELRMEAGVPVRGLVVGACAPRAITT